MRYFLMRPKIELVFDKDYIDLLPDEDVVEEDPPTEPRPELTQFWAENMNEITEVRRIRMV